MYQNQPWFENNSGFNFDKHEKPFIDPFYCTQKMHNKWYYEQKMWCSYCGPRIISIRVFHVHGKVKPKMD